MEEEVQVLRSIYQELCVISLNEISIEMHCLKGPVTAIIMLPSTYPVALPTFEILSFWKVKQAGPSVFEEMPESCSGIIQAELERLHKLADGQVFLYEWIEYLREYMRITFQSDDVTNDEALIEHLNASLSLKPLIAPAPTMIPRPDPINCPMIYTASDSIVDRKSVFVGHFARISSILQVSIVLDTLLSNKRFAKASHNISSYRITSGNVVKQDADDDGETAAGLRLLHLLQLLHLDNIVVIVSRFYGGIKLGPSRFKHINNAAKNVLKEFNAL